MKIQSENSKFIIRLAGVSEGTHRYIIDCNEKFFESSEVFDIEKASIQIEVEMKKMERSAHFSFHFSGNLEAECDRCLEKMNYPFDFETKLIVNFTSSAEQQMDDDEVWTVWEKTYEIDFYQYIYEAIVLELPQQFIHPDDEEGNSTCNPEMLETLASYGVVFEDEEYDDEEGEDEKKENDDIDPRWEILKNIKLN